MVFFNRQRANCHRVVNRASASIPPAWQVTLLQPAISSISPKVFLMSPLPNSNHAQI